MGDHLIMSQKERDYKAILEGVLAGHITLKDAALKMGVSYRHAKRLKRRYVASGDAGLVHKSRGRTSARAKSAEFKARVLSRYQEIYYECGPTHASELLAEEDGIEIHPETLRLWLLEAGLWARQRKRKPYRSRRPRRPRFGEMLQIDGSEHHWFGAGKDRCCLLNMIDDATNVTLAQLDTGETTHVLLSVLRSWIKRYGVPKSVYVDLKNVYVSGSKESFSVFEQVCEKLSITIIKAYSPQAKGRIERRHGIFQDRLVKELKIKGIETIEEANNYLNKDFLKKLNKKFTVEAEDPENAHRDAALYGSLEQVICWESERVLRNDYTVQFDKQHYQIMNKKEERLRPKSKLKIRKHLNGQLSIWFGEKRLKYRKIDVTERIKPEQKKKPLGPSKSEIARRNKHKTPWSRGMKLGRYDQAS